MDDVMLLMTSSVDPGQALYVEMRDTKTRHLQYLCGLVRWIRDSCVNRIIYCDNTGFQWNTAKIDQYAASHGKSIEWLFYADNKSAGVKGKGYGEGEIMRYILDHSKSLKPQTEFFKITGRLFVENFNDLYTAHRAHNAVFRFSNWKYPSKPSRFAGRCFKKMINPNYRVNGVVLTNFYKCSVEFYRRHLARSYQAVDDKGGYYLEHAYYDALFSLQDELASFAMEPEVAGYQASTGLLYGAEDYSEEVKAIATAMLC